MRSLFGAGVLWYWAQCICLVAASVEQRAAVPTPVSVTPSEHFEGDDGSWSTFELQIGEHGQGVRVFLSTASWQTWAIFSAGCPTSITATIPNCADQRGMLYNSTNSTTWEPIGGPDITFALEVDDNLGINRSGIFGNETIQLGYPGSGGPKLQKQVLGEINALEFWLGYFGVNPKPTNWTGFEDGQASYMATLKTENMIPSVSFGYTAGNPYRLGKVYGSLTLGGYDSARFEPNSLIMNFAPDVARDLVVGLQSVKTDMNQTSTDLLPNSIVTYVDSTATEIWLPLEACQAFENAFNLTWDANNTIYSITGDQHDALVAANPNITFKVSDYTGGPTIDLVLPYDSFDLSATWPRVPSLAAGESVLYFPLHRAANESQYTLGRTFLQEVYLIVDWENSTFSLSQCIWPTSGLSSKLITINSTAPSSTSSAASSSSTSSSGKTIGIAVGITIIVLIVFLITGFLFLRPRRPGRAPKDIAEKPDDAIQEIQGDKGPIQSQRELATGGDHEIYEAPGSVATISRAISPQPHGSNGPIPTVSTPMFTPPISPMGPLELRASEADLRATGSGMARTPVSPMAELNGDSVAAELVGSPVSPMFGDRTMGIGEVTRVGEEDRDGGGLQPEQ